MYMLEFDYKVILLVLVRSAIHVQVDIQLTPLCPSDLSVANEVMPQKG